MAVSRHLGYYGTGKTIRRPRNPCLEPNMEWIGCTVCEIFAFKHWRSQDFVLRGAWEPRRRVRNAEGVERGGEWKRDIPLPSHFGAFWAWKNESGGGKFDIFCQFYSTYLESNLQLILFPHSLGCLGPSAPPPSGYAYAFKLYCESMVKKTRAFWKKLNPGGFLGFYRVLLGFGFYWGFFGRAVPAAVSKHGKGK